MISKSKLAIIETTGLYKAFGNNKVLRGVNLSIQKGESLAIIGTSGSGKSVLIKNIIRILFSKTDATFLFLSQPFMSS